MAYRPLAIGGQLEDLGAPEDVLAQSIKAGAARDLRKKAVQDAQKAELDLAKQTIENQEYQRGVTEASKARDVNRQYIFNRDGAMDLPIGVQSPEFGEPERPSNAPFGPMNAPAPKPNRMERRTTLDLAAINPDLAETFRKGQLGERQGLEDRSRGIAKEDQAQIDTGAAFAELKRKNAAGEGMDARQQAEIERQNRAKNNLDWFVANTGRITANNKGAAGKPIPASAQTQILENVQNAKKAQKALALLSGHDVGSQKGDKKPSGFFKGILGTFGSGTALDYSDPEGIATRAAISDLGSMVIHDRSGAAVTASESPRLRPFIPSTYDNPKTAKTKLKRFIQEYNSIVSDQAQQYGPDAGYSASPLIKQYMENMPTAIFDSEKEAEAANLPVGTRILIDGREVVVE